jgi:hypothetical protein
MDLSGKRAHVSKSYALWNNKPAMLSFVLKYQKTVRV